MAKKEVVLQSLYSVTFGGKVMFVLFLLSLPCACSYKLLDVSYLPELDLKTILKGQFVTVSAKSDI